MKPWWSAAFCAVVLGVGPVVSSGADEPPAGTAAASPAPSKEAIEFFEQRVRPLLAANCHKCHGPEKQQAGLRLDSRTAVLQGSDSGPVAIPGDPAGSPLIEAISHAGEPKMPPDNKLPDESIALLTEWVKLGLPWGDDQVAATAAPTEAPGKGHWAFQPIAAPAPPPAVKNSSWAVTPVDHFILAAMEREGLTPAPGADRRTLIRRATYDLLGLPPTAAEIEAFVSDPAPDAFARLVDRLLASPHYGERWGRHWLDVARYADTKGYVFEENRDYKNAYRYRDWVIRSLNDDLPYDQFLVLQVAADRLPHGDDRSSLAAMGFLTVGRRFLNNQHDIIDDRLDVLIRGTMGLTIGCARCHDHKYDPIPSKDYYSLYGVFASTIEPKEPDDYMTLADAEEIVDPYVFLRGNPRSPGEATPRQFLAVVAGQDRQPFREGSGRLELARAIASGENPLTARVMANRVWMHHFGAGIVRSPSNFGVRGEAPTHRELLDYLAWQFVQQGWSLKKLHRMIMVSSVYQQSSQGEAGSHEKDPGNYWLARAHRRRLDFEAMRDAILAASGELDLSIGGPSVPLTGDVTARRRAVYGRIDRQNLPAVMRTFDFASPDTHSPQRFETTVPPQALFLMNSQFMAEQSRALSRRSEVAAQSTAAGKIEQLFRIVYGRLPSAEEASWCEAYIAGELAATAPIVATAQTAPPPVPPSQAPPSQAPPSQAAPSQAAPAQGEGGNPTPAVAEPSAEERAWAKLSQALLLSNEFIFID